MAADSSTGPLTDRDRLILERIVEYYIETGEPVGSKTLVERYRLSVSPATVRNVMSALDEEGYLHQPHRSAGRIPSEKAYRYYVNELMREDGPLSDPRRRSAFERVRARVLAQYERLAPDQWDDLFSATCQLLAQLSDYIGVVVRGQLRRSVLDRIELVPLGGSQILTVLILRPGMVKQRIVSLRSRLASSQLPVLATLLNERLAGKTLGEIQEYANEIRLLYELFDGAERQPAVEITRGVFLHEYGQDVYWDGLRNFVAQTDFSDPRRASAFYETLESRNSLARLLTPVRAEEEGRVRVLIGSEIPSDGLDECSVIAATYSLSGQLYGMVGVIGPMRMEYPRLIPLVRLTAHLMSHYFENRSSA